ncbi:MAG: hypothetical protein JJE03_01795 [Peptostreptococcaceae bacterium]|nr:hypothetical protein [Peptostreptococcaceae bacterium]
MKWLFTRKKLLILVIIGINFIVIKAVCGAFTVGEINPIDASANVVYPPQIIFDNDNSKISIKVGNIKDNFIAYATVHNRTAEYEFDVIYSTTMTVKGEIIVGDYLIEDEGTYLIKAKCTVRYKTSKLNIKKGWPKYYNISSESELFIEGKEEITPIETIIMGKVKHTTEWNKKRMLYNLTKGYEEDYNGGIGFNEYIEKSNPRYINVFWPGENFILECTLNKENVDSIEVSIKNTDYRAILKRKSGDLFTGIMFNNDRDKKSAKELVFVFEANGASDRVSIIIDGMDEYWGLHRKK